MKVTGAAVVASDVDQQKAAPLGLFVLLLLGVACYFLFKSMSRHLRRVRDEFPAAGFASTRGVGPTGGPARDGARPVGARADDVARPDDARPDDVPHDDSARNGEGLRRPAPVILTRGRLVEPGASPQRVADPGRDELRAIEPGSIEPRVIEPRVIEPRVIEPGVVQPRVIEPGVVQPRVIEPDDGAGREPNPGS